MLRTMLRLLLLVALLAVALPVQAAGAATSTGPYRTWTYRDVSEGLGEASATTKAARANGAMSVVTSASQDTPPNAGSGIAPSRAFGSAELRRDFPVAKRGVYKVSVTLHGARGQTSAKASEPSKAGASQRAQLFVVFRCSGCHHDHHHDVVGGTRSRKLLANARDVTMQVKVPVSEAGYFEVFTSVEAGASAAGKAQAKGSASVQRTTMRVTR